LHRILPIIAVKLLILSFYYFSPFSESSALAMFQPHNTNMESFVVDPTPPYQGSSIICSRPRVTSSAPAPPARLKRRTDWISIYDILGILWLGMTVTELRETMEAVYGFTATSETFSLAKFEEV
jgi:hypothetical protein